jgi:hypothetical protein
MAIGQSIGSCRAILDSVMAGAYIKGPGDASVAAPLNQQQFALTLAQNREEIVLHLVSRGVDDHLETCAQVVGELEEHQFNNLAVKLVEAFVSTEIEETEAPPWYIVALETSDKAMNKADAAQAASRKRRAQSQLVPENPLAQAVRCFNDSVIARQNVARAVVANAVAAANAAGAHHPADA